MFCELFVIVSWAYLNLGEIAIYFLVVYPNYNLPPTLSNVTLNLSVFWIKLKRLHFPSKLTASVHIRVIISSIFEHLSLFILGLKRKERRKRKGKEVTAKTHSLCSLSILWQDWHNSKSEDPSWPINFTWKWLDKNDHGSRFNRNDRYDELH
jgi:hypothetical protein